MNTDGYLRINELKNALYCMRMPFYALCMGIDRETGLSRMGIIAEAEAKQKANRRKYALHAVVLGERVYNLPVFSHVHELVGQLDEMVVTSDGVYLIDYKDTDKDFGYWRIQMAAYRLCMMERDEHPILGCFVYSIPSQSYTEVKITSRDEHKLVKLIANLRELVSNEICPPPVEHLGKCRICQYRRFCNDIF